MKEQNAKIQRQESLTETVKSLGEDELRFLNHLVVERLQLISQAKSTTLMAGFARGNSVSFITPNGNTLRGIVTRLNKKTITVATEDGCRWNVAPGLLTRIELNELWPL